MPVTNRASPLEKSMWQPTEQAEVTGPGTAKTGRPIAWAACAVDRAPERAAGLDDDRLGRQGRHQGAAAAEPHVGRRGPQRGLGDQQPAVADDALEEGGVRAGVGPVQAAGGEEDGRALPCTAVAD